MSEGAGGRYQRSPGGLVGAMILTVLAVLGFVVFRSVFSDEPGNADRAALDYRSDVADLQDAGIRVVYPDSLPEGWKVTAVDVEPVRSPGEQPGLTLDLFTVDGDYAGVTLVEEDVEDVLAQDVDEDPDEADPLVDSPGVVADWDGWTDDGGDTAYTASFDGRTLMVFGSADADQLRDLAGRLTDAPVEAGGVSSSAPSSPNVTPAG